MPRLCTVLDPADANGYIRNTLGPLLTPADKRAIAAEFGVSYRTVNNWTTQSGRGTNFVSARLAPADPMEWPGRYRKRGNWMLYARDGYVGALLFATSKTATCQIRETDPASAVADMRRWGTSEDRWESEAIQSAALSLDGEGWYLAVVYAIEWSQTVEVPVVLPVCDEDGEDEDDL